MSHQIRIDRPGLLQHLSANVNWGAWHIEEAGAKRCLAQLIGETAEAFGVDIFAAVLMSNHMHLVLRSPPELIYKLHTSRRMPNRHYRPWPKGHQKSTVIAQFMRSVCHRMSLRRQRELGVSGRFWRGRYDAKLILDATSLIVRMAYDHRNPVKQGMVERPEQFAWSTAATWRSGEFTALPVLIRQPLPFGLTHDELRRRLLRFQNSKVLDHLDDDLKAMWSRPGPIPTETWAELLRKHGHVQGI